MIDRQKLHLTLHFLMVLITIADHTIVYLLLTNIDLTKTVQEQLATVLIPQVVYVAIYSAYLSFLDKDFDITFCLLIFFVPVISGFRSAFFAYEIIKPKDGINSSTEEESFITDEMLSDFHEMFTEFTLAETKKNLSNSQNADSFYIAQKAIEGMQGFFLLKYRITPEQFDILASKYARSY